MAWYTRLTNLVRSDRLTRDIDREMAFHLAERADALVAAGMSESDARREARRRFGNPGSLKERTRDMDVLGWLESLAADLRYAARALRSSPGYTVVVILSLGLGIGANTAIFSLIDAMMLKSLPIVRPQEVLQVTLGARGTEFTNPLWEAIRDRQDAFSGLLAYANESFDLAKGGEARWVGGALVSGDFFPTLGLRPEVGRLLTRDDDRRGCAPIAVLGEGFWRSNYGGEANAVGKVISLDGHPFTIVGVAPAGFFGLEVGRNLQVYAPLCTEAILRGKDSALDQRSNWFLNVFGRPKPELGTEQARSRLAAIAPAVMQVTVPHDWDADDQRGYLRSTLDVQPGAQGRSPLRMEYRGALLALMAAVGVVLLIACANVANLLLARASTRQREIAVRLAIGASRGRIVRQLLTESVLLALLGAAAGVLFARWGSTVLVSFLGAGGRRVSLDLALDGRILAFTIAVATVTGICCGLAPAIRATRVSPQAAMQSGARGVVEGQSRFSVGKLLVVAQFAFSLVLVMCAGLLLGTLRRLVTLDPGFTRDGVVMVTAELRAVRWPKARMEAGRRELLERLRAIPGVAAASASMIMPISGHGWNGPADADGYVAASKRDALVFFNAVSDDFFETMQTRLLAGRDFDQRDALGTPPVVIVNQTVARKFFGAQDPVGKQLRLQTSGEKPTTATIVGLVEDAKYATLRETPRPTVYLPTSQSEPISTAITFELRVVGAPASYRPLITEAVAQVSTNISLQLTTLDEVVDVSLNRERMLATLSGFFGALALLLAVLGLYGTISYTVVRRRNEIGIRMTLGAARATVLRMVLAEVSRMAAMGIVLGALGALAATRLIASFLFGVTARDPATLLISASILAVVGIAAGALPAWRAARLDPMVALREQ